MQLLSCDDGVGSVAGLTVVCVNREKQKRAEHAALSAGGVEMWRMWCCPLVSSGSSHISRC